MQLAWSSKPENRKKGVNQTLLTIDWPMDRLTHRPTKRVIVACTQLKKWLVSAYSLFVLLGVHGQFISYSKTLTFIRYCPNLSLPICKIKDKLVWGPNVKSVGLRFPLLLGLLERSSTVVDFYPVCVNTAISQVSNRDIFYRVVIQVVIVIILLHNLFCILIYIL